MKIKVPKNIKMGIHKYSVSFNRGLADDVERVCGLTDFEDMAIGIYPLKSQSRRDVILLHEIIHTGEEAFHFLIDEQTNFRIAECMMTFLKENLNIEFDWSDIPEVKS